jgi:small-conductance mechanosensitive channel
MATLFEILYGEISRALPRIGTGAAIFAGFLLGARIAGFFIARAGRRTRAQPDLIRLLGRAAQIAIGIFGAVTAFGTMGVDVGALIAGLGLSSFALGFALKDALSNLLSGISILLYRPFRVGNRIAATGMEGTVVEINFRYTVLDGGDKRILIPNAFLFTNVLTVAKQ